jgi:hypothetical protein
MNCDAYMEHIGGYCENALAPELRVELELHVATCARCRAFHEIALEITCREVAELYDYVDGLLTPERKAVFDRHFTICDACRDYLASYRTTIRLEQVAFADTGPVEPLSEELVRSILARRGQA